MTVTDSKPLNTSFSMPQTPHAPQSQTDASILEYLLSNVHTALVEEWRMTRRNDVEEGDMRRVVEFTDRSLILANSFLAHYSQTHGDHSLPQVIRFRLILTRFLAMLIRGIELSTDFSAEAQDAAFDRLRNRDNTRAFRWGERRVGMDIDDTGLYNDTMEKLKELGVKRGTLRRKEIKGTIKGPATLIDCLPLFVTIGAWVSSSNATRIQMNYIEALGWFMSLAFSESYLSFEDAEDFRTKELLVRAFSYGPNMVEEDITPTELLHVELFTMFPDVAEEMEEVRSNRLEKLPNLLLNVSGQRHWDEELRPKLEENVIERLIGSIAATMGRGELGERELVGGRERLP